MNTYLADIVAHDRMNAMVESAAAHRRIRSARRGHHMTRRFARHRGA